MALPNLPSTSSLPSLSTNSAPTAPHVAYVLLAEFDIDEGSLLRHSYPCATGTDEHLLAEHMLPDGAHDREGDSTVFYLNQITALTVDPSLGGSSSPTDVEGSKGKGRAMENCRRKDEHEGALLYVISVVRTQKLSTVRRGALVKALAVVTRHPFIQIYKNFLVLALDDYFKDPTIGVLRRFYDALNAMDMASAPQLSLDERLILRATERLDMFDERFPDRDASSSPFPPTASTPSLSQSRLNNDSTEVLDSDHRSISSSSISSHASKEPASRSMDGFGNQRTKSRANTISSEYEANGLASVAGRSPALPSSRPKDTHWFEAEVVYTRVDVPPKPAVTVPFTVRVPLSTFPGEVGDYSLIKLLQTFSNPTALSATGPLHPHLHTSGQLTHPIILLFNALITHKRVVFLGHGQAAGEVASFVLAACALGSGCGSILKGFTDRAFPYTNLTNLDNLQAVPGYIAGVCNPAFADRPGWWDVLCNIETGKIVVSKDITPAPPPARSASLLAQASVRSQASAQSIRMQGADVLASLAGEEGEFGKLSLAGGVGVVAKVDAKAESADNVFMEEITNLVSSHMGESIIRHRFTEFAHRFVALASRYEEDIDGSTTIGWPSAAFAPAFNGVAARLGSGVVFVDDGARARDMAANAGRIEGWRVTPSYTLYQQAFAERLADSPIRGFDLLHQIARFRNSRNVPAAEVSLILQTLASHLRTEEQVTALLACLPTFTGGLLPITFGLFHRDEEIRDVTVDILTALSSHPTGCKFILSLNAFQRSAFVRLAQERRDLAEPPQNTPPPQSSFY